MSESIEAEIEIEITTLKSYLSKLSSGDMDLNVSKDLEKFKRNLKDLLYLVKQI